MLQLALAIDYAIILLDRFLEEKEYMDSESALKLALSKAIPEISSSSLTTVSGMLAMCFMQFRIGYDMGIVLIKAICSGQLDYYNTNSVVCIDYFDFHIPVSRFACIIGIDHSGKYLD